jgi:outer membrane protein OmpA-like peptidoglycan-associated protein
MSSQKPGKEHAMKRTAYYASNALIVTVLICSPSLINPAFAQRTQTTSETQVLEKPADAAVTVELMTDGRTIIVLDDLFFKPDHAELNLAGRRTLSRLVSLMAENPRLVVWLSGETPWSESYPDSLSNLRADSVRRFLIDQGLSVHRVVLLVAAHIDGTNERS